MRVSEDGVYTYLDIPNKYGCVYTKLLIKLSDLGIDIIKDCTSTCKGINRQVINCWNMFQGACAAYQLGEIKKADMLVDYINKQFNFGCEFDDRFDPVHVYIGHTDIDPNVFINMNIEDIIPLANTKLNMRKEENRELIVHQEKSIHFVIVPEKVILDLSKFGKILTTHLYRAVSNEGAYRYTRGNTLYDDTYHTIYFFYSPIGAFDEDIELTFKIK